MAGSLSEAILIFLGLDQNNKYLLSAVNCFASNQALNLKIAAYFEQIVDQKLDDIQSIWNKTFNALQTNVPQQMQKLLSIQPCSKENPNIL